MKYKYKYLILSFITIGNLVSSPVFALTGETKTSESTTTTTETVPITESLNKETDKKTNSSSMPEVSEDTCKEENTKNTSVVENKENSKEEKARKVKFSNSKAIKTESSNWQVEDKGNYVLLKKYTGSGKHIVVPGDFYGKPTKLKGIDKSVFPNMNSAKSFEVLLRYDGAKVGLESQTLDSAFENTSFESINLSGLDTSNVTNMRSMFRSCHVLTNLDLSCFDTSNVTNMIGMFEYCTSLKSLDVSHFDTSNVTNMNNMFYGLNDPGGIVIITKDFKISNYAFPGDVRSLVTPVLVANGGRFPTTVNKYYFTKIVYTPEEFGKINTVTAFEQFKKENIPTKNGVDFLGWELISGNDSSAQNVYPDLYGVEYRAKWGKKDYGKIQIPSQDTDNVKPDHSSIYGIAYMPKVFNFVSKLEDSGNQIIPLTNAGSHNYHVAVRDQRMIKDSWVLQAQLMWDGKEIPGAEILTLHQGNNVLKNINNGEKDFTNNDLIECPTNDVSGVQKVVIGSSGPIPIMTAQDVEHNAVYDYDLGNVTLRIPETKYVQPGKYSGNIEWNLIKGP